MCAACPTPRLNQSYELRPLWEQHLRYVPLQVRKGYNIGMFNFKQFVHSYAIGSHIMFKIRRFEIAEHGIHVEFCTPLHASPGVSSCCAGSLIFRYSTCCATFLYLFPASSSAVYCPVQVETDSLTLRACIVCSKLHPRGRRCGCLVTLLLALRQSILSTPAHCRSSDLARVRGFIPPDGLPAHCGGLGLPLCRQSQKHGSATPYGFVIIIIIIIIIISCKI